MNQLGERQSCDTNCGNFIAADFFNVGGIVMQNHVYPQRILNAVQNGISFASHMLLSESREEPSSEAMGAVLAVKPTTLKEANFNPENGLLFACYAAEFTDEEIPLGKVIGSACLTAGDHHIYNFASTGNVKVMTEKTLYCEVTLFFRPSLKNLRMSSGENLLAKVFLGTSTLAGVQTEFVWQGGRQAVSLRDFAYRMSGEGDFRGAKLLASGTPILEFAGEQVEEEAIISKGQSELTKQGEQAELMSVRNGQTEVPAYSYRAFQCVAALEETGQLADTNLGGSRVIGSGGGFTLFYCGGSYMLYRTQESIERLDCAPIAKLNPLAARIDARGYVYFLLREFPYLKVFRYADGMLKTYVVRGSEDLANAFNIRLTGAKNPLIAEIKRGGRVIVREYMTTFTEDEVTLNCSVQSEYGNPVILCGADTAYRLIFDYATGEIFLQDAAGTFLNVDASIVQKILMSKEMRIFERYLFVDAPTLEIYDLVTGKRILKGGEGEYYSYAGEQCLLKRRLDGSYSTCAFDTATQRMADTSQPFFQGRQIEGAAAFGSYLLIREGNRAPTLFRFRERRISVALKQTFTEDIRVTFARKKTPALHVLFSPQTISG